MMPGSQKEVQLLWWVVPCRDVPAIIAARWLAHGYTVDKCKSCKVVRNTDTAVLQELYSNFPTIGQELRTEKSSIPTYGLVF